MAKTKKLKDGTEVVVRPLEVSDLDNSYSFFQSLQPEDRNYLRVDVTDRKVVGRRLESASLRNIMRIGAFVDGEIVADGALEVNPYGWDSHIGEIRLIVARSFQRKGLGMVMAEEIYSLALNEKVEEMVVKIAGPQQAASSIFHRMGFHDDVVIKSFVKDLEGKKHDLILLRCDLEALWQELEGYFAEAEHTDMN
jgi:hypothetical protein